MSATSIVTASDWRPLKIVAHVLGLVCTTKSAGLHDQSAASKTWEAGAPLIVGPLSTDGGSESHGAGGKAAIVRAGACASGCEAHGAQTLRHSSRMRETIAMVCIVRLPRSPNAKTCWPHGRNATNRESERRQLIKNIPSVADAQAKAQPLLLIRPRCCANAALAQTETTTIAPGARKLLGVPFLWRRKIVTGALITSRAVSACPAPISTSANNFANRGSKSRYWLNVAQTLLGVGS